MREEEASGGKKVGLKRKEGGEGMREEEKTGRRKQGGDEKREEKESLMKAMRTHLGSVSHLDNLHLL